LSSMSQTDDRGGRGIKGPRWVGIFFLRFVIVSIVLYIVYRTPIRLPLFSSEEGFHLITLPSLGAGYMRLVALCSKPLLALFKYKMIMEKALTVTEEISLNPIVFLSLVLAVAKLPALTRLKAAIWGVVILTAANTVTVFLIFLSAYRGSEKLWTGTEFFNLTINFFLPLLLWFLLLPIGSLFPQFRRGNR
jgi:hypothetical protein